MAQLIVIDLDESVKDALRQLAAKHKRSMGAEARDIITRAVSGRAVAAELAPSGSADCLGYR